MIQIRKEENQKKQKEKKLKVYKVNTHKKTVIALWVLLAVSFLFAVYKNFTAIDIHTVHETKVIEEKIIDTHKIENFVENFAEVYYSWEQSAASIDTSKRYPDSVNVKPCSVIWTITPSTCFLLKTPIHPTSILLKWTGLLSVLKTAC